MALAKGHSSKTKSQLSDIRSSGRLHMTVYLFTNKSAMRPIHLLMADLQDGAENTRVVRHNTTYSKNDQTDRKIRRSKYGVYTVTIK